MANAEAASAGRNAGRKSGVVQSNVRGRDVMVEVIAQHLGAVQFEITARGHKIYSDQPFENGGFDEGMTPPELMLASLGACAGYYAVDYLKREKLPTQGVRVRTRAEKVKGPPRLDDIHIELECPGAVEERQRNGVLDAVRKCLIHNTLLHTPKIRVDLLVPVAGRTGEMT
jgi:putative redox protein